MNMLTNGMTMDGWTNAGKSVKALSHYNVLANVCRRMLAYALNLIKNQRKSLSELMQSGRATNIERMSNLLVNYS